MPPPWPDLELPITPPFPPMEAKRVEALPRGATWQFEPKWDGFRCLAFRDRERVALQSKAGQPLSRYFPELTRALAELTPPRFVLDGEIVIPTAGGFSFELLLQRIHPAESRVRMLAAETPAALLAFDLLVDPAGHDLTGLPLAERRAHLEALASSLGDRVRLSPASRDPRDAESWLEGQVGLDGVVAKRLDEPYRSGERTAMQKVKKVRTADCVVGGFRWAKEKEQVEVGSLLLGLYDDRGLLQYVGHTSAFTRDERRALTEKLLPLVEPPGFTGDAPGGPSRWARDRSTEWVPLRPVLVVEVAHHHASGGRFRHGTQLVRWRPDKDPRQCTFEQVDAPGAAAEGAGSPR